MRLETACMVVNAFLFFLYAPVVSLLCIAFIILAVSHCRDKGCV